MSILNAEVFALAIADLHYLVKVYILKLDRLYVITKLYLWLLLFLEVFVDHHIFRFRIETRHLWNWTHYTKAVDFVIQVTLVQHYFINFLPRDLLLDPWRPSLFLFVLAESIYSLITVIYVVFNRNISRDIKLVLFIEIIFIFVTTWFLQLFVVIIEV